jgi:hypothetical protein
VDSKVILCWIIENQSVATLNGAKQSQEYSVTS